MASTSRSSDEDNSHIIDEQQEVIDSTDEGSSKVVEKKEDEVDDEDIDTAEETEDTKDTTKDTTEETEDTKAETEDTKDNKEETEDTKDTKEDTKEDTKDTKAETEDTKDTKAETEDTRDTIDTKDTKETKEETIVTEESNSVQLKMEGSDCNHVMNCDCNCTSTDDCDYAQESDATEHSIKEKFPVDPTQNYADNFAIGLNSKDNLSQQSPKDDITQWNCLACPVNWVKSDSSPEIDEFSPEQEKEIYIAREKRRVIKNLCIISIAFLFVFSAFQGLTRLQSSLHRDRGMGTICQSVMYSALVASCLILPNISIHTIGLKKTIIWSFFGYIIWFAANGYAVWGTMVTASILMGIAAGPLWTAQSSYFTILATRYAELSGKDRSAVLSKFFGIFFAFYQFSGIVGSIITTVVLLPSERNTTSSSGDKATSCGARDCPWAESIQGHLAKPDKITVWIMLAVFLLMSFVAVLITYYFVEDLPCSESHLTMTSTTEASDTQSDKTSHTIVSDTTTYVSTLNSMPREFQNAGEVSKSRPPSIYSSHNLGHEIQLFDSVECVYPGDFENVFVKPKQDAETQDIETSTEIMPKKNSICNKENSKMVFSTLRQLRHLDQLLLVPLTFYMGLEQGTSAANFTKSYIACSIGIAKIGLVYISYSAINGCASFTSGRLVKYTGRFPVLTTAFIGDLAVQSTLQLWTPEESQQYVLYILAGMWGFTDGIWHTQVSALYGAIFTQDPTAAFSCMRLLKAIGAITAFAYSSSLCTSVKVYILTSLLIVSMVGYYVVEFRQKFSKKKKVHFEEDMVVS